jgi:hypothetical protein
MAYRKIKLPSNTMSGIPDIPEQQAMTHYAPNGGEGTPGVSALPFKSLDEAGNPVYPVSPSAVEKKASPMKMTVMHTQPGYRGLIDAKNPAGAVPDPVYAGTGSAGEPFYTNRAEIYGNPKTSKTGWKKMSAENLTSAMPSVSGGTLPVGNRGESLDNAIAFNDHRDAVDAIIRSYNQPTAPNLKAAAMAQRFLETQGNVQNEAKRIQAATGLSKAQIDQIIASTAKTKKETGVLPSTSQEAVSGKVAEIAAAHPKSDFGVAAAALAKALADSGNIADYDKMLTILKRHMSDNPAGKDEFGYTANAAGAAPAASEYSPEDIAFTAQKYGISEDEVKKRLGIQ